MSVRHHPILYSFEEPTTSSSLHHSAGINDIAPSFRPGYFFSAGRDGKLLEWKINNNNNTSASPSSTTTTTVPKAVARFKVHADWINRVLPIPNVGFVTAGADHIVRLSQVRKIENSNNHNNDDDLIIDEEDLDNEVDKTHQQQEKKSTQQQQQFDHYSYETISTESFKHHGGTVKAITWLHHFNGDSLPGDPSSSTAPSAYNYDKLAMCSSDGNISTLSMQREGGAGSGKILHASMSNKAMPVSLVPGQNASSTFFVGTMNGVVHSVDIRSKLAVNEIIEEAHTSVVRDMLFYENRNILVTAGSDSLIRLWDTRHVMDPLMTIDAHGDAVWRLQKYFPSSTSSSSSSSSSTRNNNNNTNNLLCFFSCGREGTVQLHDLTPSSRNSISSGRKMTSCLAQTSHPVTSFMHLGDKLFVGTSRADILEFDTDLKQQQQQARKSSSSTTTTPCGLKLKNVMLGGGGNQSNDTSTIGLFANFNRTDDEESMLLNASIADHPTAALSSTVFEDVVGDDEKNQQQQEQQQEQEEEERTNLLLLSPFKPERTEARCSAKWATPVVFNDDNSENSSSSFPQHRPPLLPTPSTIYTGGIGFVQSTTFPTRMHVAVLQTNGEISVYDYINCTKVATFSKNVRFDEDVVSFLEMKPGICPNWCQVNCNWGGLTVTMSEGESNGSFLNGWELQKGAYEYMMRLVEEIEMRADHHQQKSSRQSSASLSKELPKSPAFSEKVSYYLQPPSQSQFGVDELAGLRNVKNVVSWAFQRGIIPAAREGRIRKFIIKNLSCHISDEDRRSQFELPAEQLVFCQNFVMNLHKSKEAEARGEQLSSKALLPQPSSAVPRWLLVLAERKVTTKDPSSQSVTFTCEPHPNPPNGFKKLPSVFDSKDKNKAPSLTHQRSTQLADLCYVIAKSLKKLGEKGPLYSTVMEARQALNLPALNTSGVVEVDQQQQNNQQNSSSSNSKNNNNNNNQKFETVDRTKHSPKNEYAQPEEWIVLFNGATGTIIDSSLLLSSSNAMFKEQTNRGGFHIKYASIV